MQKPHSRRLQLCKVLPAAALTLLASGIAADAVIEAQTLEVKELLEVIEVIDVTAEKEIDESSIGGTRPGGCRNPRGSGSRGNRNSGGRGVDRPPYSAPEFCAGSVQVPYSTKSEASGA